MGATVKRTLPLAAERRLTSRRLEWQVAGVDLGFDHDMALELVGQTANLCPRASNPAGHTDGAVVPVNTL